MSLFAFRFFLIFDRQMGFFHEQSGFIRNYRMAALVAVQQAYFCPRTSVATVFFFTRSFFSVLSGVFIENLGFF